MPNFAANLETGEFSVEINRQLIKLFDRGFTVIQWEQRRQLQKKPLAQALHLWILSHENRPYPVTVAYLHDLTGSQMKQLKHFRAKLRIALNELQRVGVIAAWVIDSSDKVTITVT